MDRMDIPLEFFLPGCRIRGSEGIAIIHLNGKLDLGSRPDIDREPGIDLIILAQDKHHRPLAGAKDPKKCLLIGIAGAGDTGRMRMAPHACKLFRFSAQNHLVFKKICHRLILHLDTDTGDVLLYGDKILHIE